MKKIFSLLIILFIFIIHPSNSKNTPPGTDNVPANILILLDRTFSMNWPATYASGTATMLPMSAIYDPKMIIIGLQKQIMGRIGTWDTSR